MADDVIINKAEFIARSVARAKQEYAHNPTDFATDLTRQDAAILNILRACEAALDLGQYLIRREKLGIPQSARDVFTLLAQRGWICKELAYDLKRLVGFRNIAVHNYQELQLPIAIKIITNHLNVFLEYSRMILVRDGGRV